MPPGHLPFGGFPGTSYWEEALRQTQDSLEGLYVLFDPSTPWDPTGGAGECSWEEGCLGFSPRPVASITRPRIMTKMDGWIIFLAGPLQHVQNRVFHSYVFLIGKQHLGVKILSNLQSHVTNKESLQGLHDMRCQSHQSVVIQLHQLPKFGHRYETRSFPHSRLCISSPTVALG